MLSLSLQLVKRIAERYVPGVYITGERLPRAVLGLSWLDRVDRTPMVVYELRQTHRDRALTIFHEIAHHLFDIPHGHGSIRARGGSLRAPDPKVEARADSFAAELVRLLEMKAAQPPPRPTPGLRRGSRDIRPT